MPGFFKEIAEDQAPSSPSRSDPLQFLSLPQMERFSRFLIPCKFSIATAMSCWSLVEEVTLIHY